MNRNEIASAVKFNEAALKAGKFSEADLPLALRTALAQGATQFVNAMVQFQQVHGLKTDGKLGRLSLPIARSVLEAERVPTETLLGIDISGHQNEPLFDWGLLGKQDVAFGYVKATQEHFPSNQDISWQTKGLRGIGAEVGYYHFCDVSEDPVMQAELLFRVAEKEAKGPMLPPAADLEWFKDHNKLPKDAFRRWLIRHIERLRELYGAAPVLYTGPNFWAEHMGGPLDLGPVELWTVDYSKRKSPKLPAGFSRWTFRQFTGSGKLPGYNGQKLDLNRFNGSLSDLRNLVR